MLGGKRKGAGSFDGQLLWAGLRAGLYSAQFLRLVCKETDSAGAGQGILAHLSAVLGRV
jgi:hypothetical protein